LEAFSNGVLSSIITIMVLEMKVPHGDVFRALQPLIPVFLCYVLSFAYLGIYWYNHHHMLHATQHVTGTILWANLHLLFWLSLFPIVTGWIGENHFAPAPTTFYLPTQLVVTSKANCPPPVCHSNSRGIS
jgi:TMEM175 potassium channel family protein